MNKACFEIFEKYRNRKYHRDLEKLQKDLTRRGCEISSERELKEKWLKENCEDEIGMEREKMEDYEIEKIQKEKERSLSKRINILLTFIAIASFTATTYTSFRAMKRAEEANIINEHLASIEYDKAQPFLVPTYQDATTNAATIKNVGGSAAVNIFFLQQSNRGTIRLSKEASVGGAIGTNEDKLVVIQADLMYEFATIDELRQKISCITPEIISDDKNLIMIFYQNSQGEQFATKVFGLENGYGKAINFIKLNPC